MSASGSLGRSKNKHNQPRIQMKNPFLNFGPGEPSDTHKMFMEEVNGQRAHNVWKKWLSDAPGMLIVFTWT
uniref:Cytochrome c oxidase subunit 1 n=1 Tax=Bursaphelenchus xylophilus TaxID=6326 RepID=A0A1I7RY85_BURXY